MKRVIVTGSRNWPFPAIVRETLDYVKQWQGDFQLIHGGCLTGADRMADAWARDLGWEPVVFEADWGRLKKAAGPLRNTQMVQAGAEYCLGFPHPTERSSGTWDCLRKAKARRIQTWVIDGNGKASLL